MDEVSYSTLRSLQAKEKASTALSELSEDFFDQVSVFISRQKELAKGDVAKARELENALKILRDITSKRSHKVLLRALRAARVGDDGAGLAREEQSLFESVVSALRKNESFYEAISSLESGGSLSRAEAVVLRSEPSAAPDVSQKPRLRVLQDVPAFVCSDQSVRGPFKAGEEIEIPPQEAELLVKRSFAAWVSGGGVSVADVAAGL